jgi:acyl-CoA thioester hydrolase
VGADWVDYNHHLTEWAYAVVFADAGDHALVELGFGPNYRRDVGGTFYTVETHTRFLREVAEGTELEVVTGVVGVDEKRLHLWHSLRDAAIEVATQEAMYVHVGVGAPIPRPMSEAFRAAAEAELIERPAHAGRSIRGTGTPPGSRSV